ncbi:hypothetical protein N2152v2_010673 [Parachlorella kessleri]
MTRLAFVGVILLAVSCFLMGVAGSAAKRGQERQLLETGGRRRTLSAHPPDAYWEGNATREFELLGALLSDWVDEGNKRREQAERVAQANAAAQQALGVGGSFADRWQQLAQRHHSNRWRQFVERNQQLPLDGGVVSCAVSIPKVALMFLTHGPMPNERLWAEWLEGVAGRVPLQALWGRGAICLRSCLPGGRNCRELRCGAAAACHRLCRREVLEKLALPSSRADPVLRRQLLFSVYVHAPPWFPGYPPGSFFEGTLLPRRVDTSWGSQSLILAERKLLSAAFEDPTNAWFVLLDSASLPLYPAQLFWQQLAQGRRSRINACAGMNFDYMEHRMARSMESAKFGREFWRKSGQWFMLSRRHAELALADRELHKSFLLYCKVGNDRDTNRFRDCVPSEHLYPSLLAALGEAVNTTCDGSGSMSEDWSLGHPRPREYQPQEVTLDLFRRMRGSKEGCGSRLWQPALDAAAKSYAWAGQVVAAATSDAGKLECRRELYLLQGGSSVTGGDGEGLGSVEGEDPYYSPYRLPEQCDLLGRAFLGPSAQAAARLLQDCGNGLRVLPCWGPEEAAAAATNWTAAGSTQQPDGGAAAPGAGADAAGGGVLNGQGLEVQATGRGEGVLQQQATGAAGVASSAGALLKREPLLGSAMSAGGGAGAGRGGTIAVEEEEPSSAATAGDARPAAGAAAAAAAAAAEPADGSAGHVSSLSGAQSQPFQAGNAALRASAALAASGDDGIEQPERRARGREVGPAAARLLERMGWRQEPGQR